MSVYVKVATSGDLKHLGYDTDEENALAWERISDEWEGQLQGDNGGKIDVYKEIKYYEVKIACFNTLVQAAQSFGAGENFDKLVPEFCAWGFIISSFDELPSIINQSKALQIELERLRLNIAVQDDKEGRKPLNKAFFVTCVERFSDYKKRSILLENITILQFCIHYKDWQDHYERLSKGQTTNEEL